MKWINVDERYLDYLRSKEKRIPRTDYGADKYKPFFGVLFEIDDLYYITQVSHPQQRHQKMTQQKDFYKIYDPDAPMRLIAVVNLNYMFPIPKEYACDFEKKNIDTYRSFESEESKSKYIDLLDKELKVINALKLDEKAKWLYDLKIQSPDNKISKRCIDFKDMEKIAKSYNSDIKEGAN